MTDTKSEPLANEVSSPEGLGRAWLAPGLVLSGLLILGRVELLVALAEAQAGASVEWARWSVLADWPAQVVQALMMGAAAGAVVYSAQGARRPLGVFIGGLICASALTGWPMAPVGQVYQGNLPGFPSAWHLGAVCLCASALLSWVASLAERRDRLKSLLSARPLIALVAMIALGLPAGWLWKQAQRVPEMSVAEVLADFSAKRNWEVVREVSAGAVRPGLASRGGGLIMPPQSEVTLRIPQGINSGQLRLSPRMSSRLDTPIRFEVLLDGVTLLDEVRQAKSESELGSGFQASLLAVEPGQQVTLRTSHAGPAFSNDMLGNSMDCGFAGLVLEKRKAVARTHASVTSPNILFITVDGLRADRVSCYGYLKRTTPNLDALALEGVRWNNAYSTSSGTLASTASLLTGRLPYAHGALVGGVDRLPLECETLAERLQSQGVTTAAILGNPTLAGLRQLDQGFEDFDASSDWRSAEQLLPRVKLQLQAISKARFFLYVHLSDPIAPLRPLDSEQQRLGGERPADFPEGGQAVYQALLQAGELRVDTRESHTVPSGEQAPESVAEPLIPASHASWISDRYDASVASVDHAIGRILQLLHENGLTENTLVVITGSHGFELLDHGLLGYGHSVHPELVKVPMILAGLGLDRGAQVSMGVSNRWLVETLVQLKAAPEDLEMSRTHLLDPIFQAPDVFYQTSAGVWGAVLNVELQGLRGAGDVVQYSPQNPTSTPTKRRLRMYSTETDPREQIDLSSSPDYEALADLKLRQLRANLRNQRSSFGSLSFDPGDSVSISR